MCHWFAVRPLHRAANWKGERDDLPGVTDANDPQATLDKIREGRHVRRRGSNPQFRSGLGLDRRVLNYTTPHKGLRRHPRRRRRRDTIAFRTEDTVSAAPGSRTPPLITPESVHANRERVSPEWPRSHYTPPAKFEKPEKPRIFPRENRRISRGRRATTTRPPESFSCRLVPLFPMLPRAVFPPRSLRRNDLGLDSFGYLLYFRVSDGVRISA